MSALITSMEPNGPLEPIDLDWIGQDTAQFIDCGTKETIGKVLDGR